MSDKKWIKQWLVPSNSDPAKNYKVSLDADGEYHCHCWPYLRNREKCKHILRVLAGDAAEVGADLPPEPKITPHYVREVEPVFGPDKKTVIECKTPLLPLGPEHTHFWATVMFDLRRYGVQWSTLRKEYKLDSQWTPRTVSAYIQEKGRCICGPWVEDKGYVGYEIVPWTGAEKP